MVILVQEQSKLETLPLLQLNRKVLDQFFLISSNNLPKTLVATPLEQMLTETEWERATNKEAIVAQTTLV